MLPYDEGAGTAEEPMLIDFASTGVGLGMCDVAMLLAHSVSPTTLAGGGQQRLIDAYLDALEEKGVTNYDRSTAMRHFHLATVDYARFVVSRFWAGASAATFAKRAANPNVCLPNRDVEAALCFAERIDASLEVLDGGGGTCCHRSQGQGAGRPRYHAFDVHQGSQTARDHSADLCRPRPQG